MSIELYERVLAKLDEARMILNEDEELSYGEVVRQIDVAKATIYKRLRDIIWANYLESRK